MRGLNFNLEADNFIIKFTIRKNALCLRDAIKKIVTEHYTRTKFIRMGIEWHHKEGCVIPIMKG